MFTQGTFTPNMMDEALHLTAGVRYTHDNKDGTLYRVNNAVTNFSFATKNNRFDPMVTLAYDINSDINAFAKFSTGYRSGVLAQLVATGTLAMADIAVVWQSPEIPNPPVVVQSALPEDFKTALRNAMVELRTADPVALDAVDRAYGGGYRPAAAADFAPLDALFEREAE